MRRLAQLTEPARTCKTQRGIVTHPYCTNSKLEGLNIDILEKIGAFKSDTLTIDYDNTIVFNEKQDSRMTYKRDYGYQPGVCTINQGHILYIENRNGNSDAKSFQTDTLKRAFDLLDSKKIKKIHNFRADAASYQYDVISLLQNKVDNFYIGCRNSYIEKYFSKVSKWEAVQVSTFDKNLVFLYFTAIIRNLYNKVIQYFSHRNRFLKPNYRIKKFIFRFIVLPAKWIQQDRQLNLRIYSCKDYRT